LEIIVLNQDLVAINHVQESADVKKFDTCRFWTAGVKAGSGWRDWRRLYKAGIPTAFTSAVSLLAQNAPTASAPNTRCS